MKVVCSNTEDGLANRKALVQIRAAFRELTANVAKIAVGVGKPQLLTEQAADFAKMMADFKACTGEYPDLDETR